MTEQNDSPQSPDPINIALPPSRSNSLDSSAAKETQYPLKQPFYDPRNYDPETSDWIRYRLMQNYNVNTLMPPQERTGFSTVPSSRGFESIGNLLEKQLEMLRLMNERQNAAAEAQTQPVPPLPARSSSSWGALLRSVKDNIEPHVERWRSGLDALLVFIGLFSAIVTAFFVDSSQDLDEDPADRTNEILTNLTEIFLYSNRLEFSSMGLPYATEFVPEARDLRLNAYWSISLVMSISIAALAVTCRRLLSSLTKSQKVNAYKRVTEILSRWTSAEATLSYVVEALPQLMVFPVILFLAGILDFLYTSSRNEHSTSSALTTVFAASTASLSLAIVGLLYLVVDRLVVNYLPTMLSISRSLFGTFETEGEKKQSSSNAILPLFGGNAQHPSPNFLGFVSKSISNWFSRQTANATRTSAQDSSVRMLTDAEHTSFHKAIQLTHDDDQLDQAAACLESLIIDKDSPSRGPDFTYHCSKQLNAAQLKTINYLLTSEASLRSNRTASNVVSAWYGSHEPPPYHDRRLLVEHLISAARLHDYRYPDASIDQNPFLKSIEVLSRPQLRFGIHFQDEFVWSILYNCSEKSGVDDQCATYIWSKIIDYKAGKSVSGATIVHPLSRLITSHELNGAFPLHYLEAYISQCLMSLVNLIVKDINPTEPYPFNDFIKTMQNGHPPVILRAVIKTVKELYSRATFNRLSGSRYEAIFNFSSKLVYQMIKSKDDIGKCFLAFAEMLQLLVRIYGEDASEAPLRVPTRLDFDFARDLAGCLSSLLNAETHAFPGSYSRYHELEVLCDAFERYLDSLDARRYAPSDYLHGCMVDSYINFRESGDWQVMQSIAAVLRMNSNVRLPSWACTELFERYFYPMPSEWVRCITNNPHKLPEYKRFQPWVTRVTKDDSTELEPRYLYFANNNTETTTWDFPGSICPILSAGRQHRPESS